MRGQNKSSQAVREDVQEALENKREEIAGQAQKSYVRAKEKAREAADTLSDKTSRAKQMMENQLTGYNSKLEQAAERLPGDVAQTVTRYPWVTLVGVTLLGVMVGMWLKPCFKRYEYQYQYPQE